MTGVVAVKEKVVTMWSDPCVLLVFQYNWRAVTLLDLQHKLIIGVGQPLKEK